MIDVALFKNYVKMNKPCLIRNFLKNDNSGNNFKCANETADVNIKSTYSNCSIDSLINHITNMELNCYEYGCFNRNDFKFCCSNPFLESLANDPDYLMTDDKRFWKHNKNNFTRNHYDGNGVEVINICLKGSKRFYLANSSKNFNMIPLTNISINNNPDDSNYDYIIDLYPGDLLYIPSYWWHKVITLEDNSINFNFNFYCHNHILNDRQKNIFALHKLSGSRWWYKDAIHKVCKLDDISSYSMGCLFIKECYIFILVAFLMGYYGDHYGIIILLIFIYIRESKYLDNFGYGYFKTLMSFLIPILILGYFVRQSIKNTY